MELLARLRRPFSSYSVPEKAGMAAAAVVAVVAVVAFLRWVNTPTYGVLASGIEPAELTAVLDELDAAGVPYRTEAGGGTVLVPRNVLYEARADLAAAGVAAPATPPGYEILDSQGMTTTDFRQRIDYRRALEGEMAKTLGAMESVSAATVHLVVPEEPLFAEDEEPVTASVLVDPAGAVSEQDVETIVFLVSSSVEGLDPTNVTVATTDGTVLRAAGDEGRTLGNTRLRVTRDFEAALAADVSAMLTDLLGPGRASVVVRADLDLDEETVEAERYEPASATPVRRETVDESLTGTGAEPPGGTLGVDGAAVVAGDGSYDYTRNEESNELVVDRTVTRTASAPGTVNRLSVAVVVDDGSVTGASSPDVRRIEALVGAAVGARAERGDSVEVTAAPFPEAAEEPAPGGGVLDTVPTLLAGLALVVVAVAFLLMWRRDSRRTEVVYSEPYALPATEPAPAPVPVVGADILQLVERQPDEIATLLRSWLADRRETSRTG